MPRHERGHTVKSEYGRGSVFTATVLQGVAHWRPVGDIVGKSSAHQKIKHIGFTAPDVRVLIVDDIASNLLVIKGLLNPYKMDIVTCLSGREAVSLVREQHFDLVLMDHMMPDMDGVEAVSAIRAMKGIRYRDLPIIALTANAVSGMKEMFLQNGFSDFLSKPIEIPKLNDILGKWIPLEKHREELDTETASAVPVLPKIEGVDVNAGVASVGGSVERYRELVGLFHLDVESRLPQFGNIPDREGLPSFIIHAHALKNALSDVGAKELSIAAARLEGAGCNGNMTVIREILDDFREGLRALVENIRVALLESSAGQSTEVVLDDDDLIKEELIRLKKALETEDIDAVDEALAKLRALSVDVDVATAILKIFELVLMSEFREATTIVTELIRSE